MQDMPHDPSDEQAPADFVAEDDQDFVADMSLNPQQLMQTSLYEPLATQDTSQAPLSEPSLVPLVIEDYQDHSMQESLIFSFNQMEQAPDILATQEATPPQVDFSPPQNTFSLMRMLPSIQEDHFTPTPDAIAASEAQTVSANQIQEPQDASTYQHEHIIQPQLVSPPDQISTRSYAQASSIAHATHRYTPNNQLLTGVQQRPFSHHLHILLAGALLLTVIVTLLSYVFNPALIGMMAHAPQTKHPVAQTKPTPQPTMSPPTPMPQPKHHPKPIPAPKHHSTPSPMPTSVAQPVRVPAPAPAPASAPTPAPAPAPAPTPTPTPTPNPTSCFSIGVDNVDSTSALPWFQPCGWTATYVIVHYTTPNITQQNFYMTYNNSTGRWEYTVSNIDTGQVLQYAFTYQVNGIQYDTAWQSWTQP